MRKLTALFMALLLVAGNLSAQDAGEGTQVVTFRFVAGNDMFYIPWAGNDAGLERLCALIGEHRGGMLPVRVEGYCASLPTAAENLRMAFVRSNRVKSELITRQGLKEADFVTANYARAFDGLKDVVVVTLRIPADYAPPADTPADNAPPADNGTPADSITDTVTVTDTVIQSETKNPEGLDEVNLQPQSAEHEMPHSVQHDKGRPYCFALRTNLLYDAMLLPTLGVEWRINRNVGVRLDGSLAWWGGSSDKVQKMWLLNPEVRWYLLRDKRFYVGASATYGKYNIYKYPLGSLLTDDTGYQGNLWNAGLAVGYQLFLSRCFSLDFNLGLGYTRSEYDSFTMIGATRVGKERNKSKNLWGPTQAGVSLVWRLK